MSWKPVDRKMYTLKVRSVMGGCGFHILTPIVCPPQPSNALRWEGWDRIETRICFQVVMSRSAQMLSHSCTFKSEDVPHYTQVHVFFFLSYPVIVASTVSQSAHPEAWLHFNSHAAARYSSGCSRPHTSHLNAASLQRQAVNDLFSIM